MQKIDYDKIQDSLEYIKSICEYAQEDGGCANCHLGSRYGSCLIATSMPKSWTPRHPETDVFRVLEE